jgi:lysozyme
MHADQPFAYAAVLLSCLSFAKIRPMISRRLALAGLASLTVPALTGCASQQAPKTASSSVATTPAGLDAVIDISHNVTVSDFRAVRRSNILAVIHKATEGGDWVDPSYAVRQRQAEQAGLLWGAYHYGTRQYPGSVQAMAFLAAARPGPNTLIALDLEPNDPNPRNTMTYAQAEAFVITIQRTTGRTPILYTLSGWANGKRHGRRGLTLGQPIQPGSVLAQCDLWLADHREEPEVPDAWAQRGWKLWQYAADQTERDGAYGAPPKAVAGVTHCDRNLFNGDHAGLVKYWKSAGKA